MAHDGDQYYAEDNFGGHRATGKVYVGSFLSVSAAAVLGCLLMSSAVKRSPNLQFTWLQRRVGAQFMTIAYFATTNVLYFYDGRRWRTRDVNALAKSMYGPLVLDYQRRQRASAAASSAAAARAAPPGGA